MTRLRARELESAWATRAENLEIGEPRDGRFASDFVNPNTRLEP